MTSDTSFSGVLLILKHIWWVVHREIRVLNYNIDALLYKTRLRPLELVICTIISVLLVKFLLYNLYKISSTFSLKGVSENIFWILRSLPFAKRRIAKEKQKLVVEWEQKKKEFLKDEQPISALPKEGWSRNTIICHFEERAKRDTKISTEASRVSGIVYINGIEHEKLLKEVYEMFAYTNPMHVDVFPSLRLMEVEVVSMCAKLMRSDTNGKDRICGSMTSGGTESILAAVKASRDYMERMNNIKNPHMIIANSAHAAFWKAAEYFKIDLTVLPVNKEYKLSPRDVQKNIKDNTILVVASAPGYPHGIIDPIASLAKVTNSRGVLLHVDCCLGGFFLPFARQLSSDIPPFDFSINGVTSISMDLHKYGMAHNGTSVVLYKNEKIRNCQFTTVSDWNGGLYISSGMLGSRSGALIATAWASLVHLGEAGLLQITNSILTTAYTFKNQLTENIPDLEVIGDPLASVVAFKSTNKKVDIYKIGDMMSERGWHLDILQFPPALHITFTSRHIFTVSSLIKDLKVCVEELKQNPSSVKKGFAATYGAVCSIQDRTIVKEILETYQDTMLKL